MFSSGLINQVLDAILLHDCHVGFQECITFPSEEECDNIEEYTLAMLVVTGQEDSILSSVESRIEALFDDFAQDGDGTRMCRIDSNHNNSET